MLAIGLALAGCSTKEPSAADVKRDEVEDLGSDPANAGKLAAILANKREDELARAMAAAQLGQMPAGAAHALALIEAINDEFSLVRHDAIEACANLAIPSAAEPIALRLKSDPEITVRQAAASALGKIRGEASITPLLAALKDRDAGVQRLAAESLERITGQSFGRDAEAWDKWASERPK